MMDREAGAAAYFTFASGAHTPPLSRANALSVPARIYARNGAYREIYYNDGAYICMILYIYTTYYAHTYIYSSSLAI